MKLKKSNMNLRGIVWTVACVYSAIHVLCSIMYTLYKTNEWIDNHM